MSDEQWEVAATTREAILSHRSCPWGGHLIKLECRTVFFSLKGRRLELNMFHCPI